jgi:Ni/Co efflux regulator RcnB
MNKWNVISAVAALSFAATPIAFAQQNGGNTSQSSGMQTSQPSSM